jgi:hypothetical protein
MKLNVTFQTTLVLWGALFVWPSLSLAQKPIDDDETTLEVGDDDIDDHVIEKVSSPSKGQFAKSKFFASVTAGATLRSFVESNPRGLFGASFAYRLASRHILGLKANTSKESRTSADAEFKLNVTSVELYYGLAIDHGFFEGVEFGPVFGIAVVDYLSSSTAGGRYALKSGQALMGARGSLTSTISGRLAALVEVELLGYFTKPQSSWLALNPSLGLRYQW